MKYNDFIETLPNNIVQKLNSEYSKTKILNQSINNNKNNNYIIPNVLIKEKICEILLAYNIIINTLLKNNFNKLVIINLQNDYNKIKELFNINYLKINLVESTKEELIKNFFSCAKNLIDISYLNSNCINFVKNILSGLEFLLS